MGGEGGINPHNKKRDEQWGYLRSIFWDSILWGEREGGVRDLELRG